MASLSNLNPKFSTRGEKKKEKTVELKANNTNTNSSRKPKHVKADFPTLKDHSSKEKGEEKLKFKKDKK
ncbi:hypothetical protein KFK09_009564 [Dendrobium nobile]|uniref:Uncharacterized protein n=1 Tax=Dendrobium nobile TaxID=94219 RepID=A0A8T3BLA0_DENNO|nr:hypothetical protein KFK09_009564 [Dendrobium nobile]